MNRSYFITIALISLLLVSCGSRQDAAPANDSAKSTPAAASRDSVVITLTAIDSSSAFDLLRSEHKVDFQASNVGVFVKGIDSIYATSDAFWVYSVNDTMPDIAADKYRTRPGDIVCWRLRYSKP